MKLNPKDAAKMRVGMGGRFAKLKGQLARKGATDPAALAAWIGRRKFGKGQFQKMAARGRARG